MKPPSFLLQRMRRQLKQSGIEYTFYKFVRDKYGQETLDEDHPVKLVGIYHETTSYASESASEASIVFTEKSPMLLTLFQDVKEKGIQEGDQVTINEVRYKVIAILDVQNFNQIADISLEVIQ